MPRKQKTLLEIARSQLAPTESQIQKAAVARLVGPAVRGQDRARDGGLAAFYEELYLLTTFRGQSVAAGESGRMKAEGALPAYPDLFLPVARGGWHALFVEVKTPEGKITKKQKELHELLREQGNAVYVERSEDDIVKRFVWYLSVVGRAP